MTRTVRLLRNRALAILTSAGLLLAVSPVAHAQHSRGGSSSSGGSSKSGSSGGGSSSSGSSGGHATSSGGSSGGSSGPSRSTPTNVSSGSSSDGGHAVSRSGSGSTGSSTAGRSTAGSTTRDSSGDSSNAGNTDSSGTRTRDGRTAVGHAVARPPDSGTTVIVAGNGLGYYPWAWGGLGFGGYYGGYYDPGWYDPYPPVYTGGGGFEYDGKLRLKVKPREAAVYVDGYYAGRVDDFDGVFQRLKIDAGPHRVEIRLDGYETLTFDVRIDPDRTTTYEGELTKLP